MGVIISKREKLKAPVDNIYDIWSDYEVEAVEQMLAYSFIGSPHSIKQEINNFINIYSIDEIMITSHL